MREIIASTKNFSKVDMMNSRNGKALKDVKLDMISVEKLGVLHVDDDDDPRDVGVIITTDGDCLTCISSNAIEMITDCISLIDDDGETIGFTMDVRKSKQDREFIALTVHIL